MEMTPMSANRIKLPSATLLSAAALALTVLAGCQDLPLVREVHRDCANAKDVKACEDADYARLYAIERANNRNVYP